MRTNNGTTNLRNSALACDIRCGVNLQSAAQSSSIPYSEAAHRAVIALRCATSNRPFNFVSDKYYLLEIDMLRPGTHLPSPDTVSDDIKDIYNGISSQVRDYFKVCLISEDPYSHFSAILFTWFSDFFPSRVYNVYFANFSVLL